MAGNARGAMKTAAARVGLSLTEYTERTKHGEKWCTGCKAWHPVSAFVVDRSRGDGLRARCLAFDRGRRRAYRHPLHDAARSAVQNAVKRGRLANPNTVPCMDCAHRGDDRRHEYDHHLGYARENRLAVQPVCTICHADREKARRRG